MRDPHLLSPGLYLPLYCRRNNWNHPSKLITRYCPTRYLLRCSTLPLRALHRSSIRHYGWTYPLIPTIHRVHTKPDYNKNPVLGDVYRGKHHILPTALPRPIWYTTTVLGLSRRLYPMKYNLINWLNHLPYRSAYVPIYCMRSTNMQTRTSSSTWKKNPHRMVLRHTPTTPHPHRTHIHTKQHLRPHSRTYLLHGVTLAREKAD